MSTNEKKRSAVSLGPGAASLILIIVVLSMTVLAMLSLMNARNDERLSARQAEVIESVYALNVRAEEKYAALDEILCAAKEKAADEAEYLALAEASLPEGMTMDDHEISWEETDGFRTLDCAVQVLSDGEDARLEWIRYDLTANTEEEF